MTAVFEMDYSGLRPGQDRSLKEIMARIEHFDTTAIVLPCRYGKSDVIRLAAVCGRAEGRIACCLALSPGRVLRDQLVSESKWNKTLKRYRVRVDETPKTATITRPMAMFNANDETFLSTTIQLVVENLEGLGGFCDWIESVVRKVGLPVLVCIDEGHTASESNKWGKIVPALIEAGAHVVLLTATPEREDGKMIPGFDWVVLDENDVVVYRTKTHDDPKLLMVQKWQGKSRRLLLEPDCETTFAEAWMEEPACLCKASRTTFDLDLDDGRQLSGLTATEVRSVLGRVLREPEAIRTAVEVAITRLRNWREAGLPFQLIVYGGSDIEGEDERVDNKHLKAIREEFKRQWPKGWPSLRSSIITSSDGADGQPETIPDFAGNEDAPGNGDVILLKQAGGMGVDFPWVGVVLDLSPMRTYAAAVQRWFRGAMPCAGALVWDLVTPDDKLTQELFERIVTQQGGEARTSDLDLIDEYEKERKDGDRDDVLEVVGGSSGRFDDSDGRSAEADALAAVETVISQFPKLSLVYTHAELNEILRSKTEADGVNGNGVGVEIAAVQNTSDEADQLRADVNSLVKQATKRYRRQTGRWSNHATYGEDEREMWRRVKRDARWPSGPINESNDLRGLGRLRDIAAEYAKRRWDDGPQDVLAFAS